jgi:hypothetical protein
MAEHCAGPELVCEPFGGSSLCLDQCDAPGVGEGPGVGCRDDYACYPSAVGTGVCLPSCTVQPSPDEFCEVFFEDAPSCNRDTGACEL